MWMSSCSARESESEEDARPESLPQESGSSVDTVAKSDSAILPQSADAGAAYIDSFIFLGESTTYHLKSRGVLSGGENTLQVWAPRSGTMMLDHSISQAQIIYPESNSEIALADAVALKKPKYMLLTFGLNGAVRSVSKGAEYYKGCYSKLISTIKTASPETVVIIQSCFPVANNMDTSSYNVSASELNCYIDTLNGWASELANEIGAKYLNTSEILKNDYGFLKDEYQVGDGYHLTRAAYEKILYYIRTHAIAEVAE